MEILSSIVGKIGESLVLPIGEQFGYLISYKSNIMILEETFLKLREMKEAVQQSIDGAEWNQEVVPSEVKTWLAHVGERIEEVGKFLEGDAKTNRMCMNGWCPNLKLRYFLGKKAQKNTRVIAELLEEGEKYDRVFNIAPPLKARSSSTERFKDFESRKAVIRNVLEALRDEKIDMIAICGMGGIGKTEMAKEIARRVKADGLFHEVATAVVSQTPNLTKIQGELAEMLGARLNAESLHGRANELYSRLTKSKSVLVILDDVWDPLDLEDVGVYNALKEKSCKILLTSRNEETCNQMRFQKIFPVGLLSEEEAWNLFKEMAGEYINTPNLISIAEQVVRECAHLPIAIVMVGSALSNKRNEYEWKAALQQLKMSIPQNIPGLHPKVYSSIEFSYNYLGSQEAKSCFLLCCLYPEDYNIPIEHLVRYGVAKRFLNGFSIVEQIRDHVKTIVRNLQRSNLLLDGERYESIKMHDIVRDVAISIASRDEHGFMVQLDRRLEEWPQKDTYDGYTTISLLLGEMKGHPNGLKCPKLQLLRLSCSNDSETLPGNLFNGMNELKILSLQEACFSLTSLPTSIQILENLRMLNLESCRLGDVSAIETLGKLEILGFRHSKIEELPREIGNLNQLKLLDMKGCDSLKRIAAGVLSSLSRLQELYMAEFENWECTTTMEGNGEGPSNNASFAELIPYFGKMKVLEISVSDIGCLPKEFDLSNSSLRFRINIKDDGRYLFENAISLEQEDASHHWKVLESRGVFGNLKHCAISKCQHSKNIFWLATVKDLVQLKSLKIYDCQNIQEILSKEGYQDEDKVIGDIITLPNLEKIDLSSLPRLTGICKSMDSVEVEGGGSTSSTTLSHKLFSSNTILWFPNLVELYVEECESLQVIFDLEGLKVIENRQSVLALSQLRRLELWNLDGMAHVWKNIPREFQGFQNLVSIDIYRCKNLRSLLPASVAKLLVQLQSIQIRWCPLMESILQREDEGGEEIGRVDIIVFPQIHTFKLNELENLVSFSSEAHSFEWPSIKWIDLKNCPKLKTLGSKVQSRRKLIKEDAELDARAPQEPSAGSSLARELNYNPGLGNCSSTSGENKHNFNKEVTLTKQGEQNVCEIENQINMWSLFPYNLIDSLKNLGELYVVKCDSLEVIFELEGQNVEESNYIFNNLTVLSLDHLPKLLHIWKKDLRDIKGFNNLRLLQVWGCDNLKCLFAPSMAKLLVKLEKIEVHNCKEIEEILEKEIGDEETRRDVIVFPKVTSLSLMYLPKLEYFYSEDNYDFEWPSLESMTLVGCQHLKMFVVTSMKTPKLKGVHKELKAFQPMIVEDLNTTIQHIITGKVSLQESLQSLSIRRREDLEYLIEALPNDQTDLDLADAFCLVQSLELDRFLNLKEIYRTKLPRKISELGNLRSLKLYRCNRLKNVFSLPTAKGLVQLQELIVRFCENIEEILSLEGDDEKSFDVIKLPKLTYIELECLPRLIGFSQSMDPVVELLRSTAQSSLNGQEVARPTIESTSISSILFSSNTILWVPNLVELFVEKCESLQVIFDLEGLKVIENRQPVFALSQLRKLKLWNLDGMAHVWKNIPRGFQGFQNLVSIEIQKCDNLRSLLPASVAKLLAQLQSIEIWTCQLMENIIEREDEGGEEIGRANIIVFPQIHTFRLNGLENLVSFSSEAHSFEWPSIKRIALVICPKFKTFGSEVQSGRKLRKKDAKLDARAPQEPSIGSSSASTRESSRLLNRCLELSCVPRRRNSNPDQRNCSSSSGENKHNFNKDQVTLTNQDEPNVCETENQTKMCSLFPYYLIESLGNLEELFAWFCDSLEVIFELDEGLHDLEESNYIFNNLTELELYRLPKLLHIWKKGPRDIKGFNNLTELRLRGLPKLLHIWKKGPRDIKGFNNLRLLEVSECNSLKCLFTPSIAKLLVKLEEIEVDSCDEMKEIIAKESGDEEKRDHVIAFPQVKTLELVYLPKLECFCNEAIAFDWPSLENMWMIGCEELKMFAPTTSIKTPKLQRIHERLRATDPENFQPMIEGDLNTTIQHIIKRKENLQEISDSESSSSP